MPNKTPKQIILEHLKKVDFKPKEDYKYIFKLKDGYLEIYYDSDDNRLCYNTITLDENGSNRIFINETALNHIDSMDMATSFIE